MNIRNILLFQLLFSIFSTVSFAEPSLTVYSGRSDKFVKPVIAEFTKATGIKVILHTGKSTALLNKLKLEGKRTSADLFLSNDAGNLQKATDFSLLQSLSKESFTDIPPNFRSVDNSWIGLSARARVLVVNANSDLAKNVASVFDLADKKFAGRLAITNSTNGSYIAGTTVYMIAAGKEKTKAWLQGMKNNVNNKVYNKHSKIVKAVALGKKDIGLVNHYYIYRHLVKKPKAPIKIIIPDQETNGMGIAWNVAGIGISKYSKNKDAATRLVKFLISEKGQKQFAEVNHEYPTRKGINASSKVPPIDSFKVADVPMHKLGTQRNATLDLIESVGMP